MPKPKTPSKDQLMLWAESEIADICFSIWDDLEDEITTYRTWMYPVKTPKGRVLDYIDIMVEIEDEHKYLFIIVEPTIDSVTKIIRRIRVCKTEGKEFDIYERGDRRWVIISPDNTYEDLLNKKGYTFVKAPSDL